jgi:hypothetical protein
MKRLIIILPLLLLAGCAKTRLVPQAYMPTPPEVLMKAPRELNTIKVTKDETSVTDDTKKDENK